MSCSCALFETEGILCILWRNHVTHIPEFYILQRWRLDARYKNIAIENDIRPFPIKAREGLLDCGHCDPNLIQMVSDSDSHLLKLDAVLEKFAAEISNECKSKAVNDQSSQSETNIGSSGSVVVLRDGEELTVRDPAGPIPTKGRPKGASRLKSGFEDSLSQKEVKHRKCENCQQLGHYRTGCPLLI